VKHGFAKTLKSAIFLYILLYPVSAKTALWWQGKKWQTKNNIEEENYIRAGGNGFFYGPGSIHYKGQKEMATNLKHLIRKGEECCKYLLQSFESESIQKTFILYDILAYFLFTYSCNIKTIISSNHNTFIYHLAKMDEMARTPNRISKVALHWTRRGKGKSGRLIRTTLRRKITSELEEMGFSLIVGFVVSGEARVCQNFEISDLSLHLALFCFRKNCTL
jgi:hypothetical protein